MMSKLAIAGIVVLFSLLWVGCGAGNSSASIPKAPAKSGNSQGGRIDYQRLSENVGDRCYPGNQFTSEITRGYSSSEFSSSQSSVTRFPIDLIRLSQSSFLPSDHYFVTSSSQTPSQGGSGIKKAKISSVEGLSLLSDIVSATSKNGELILVGFPAKEGEGFRLDDWYTIFRAIAGNEAPGVSIDPGPDPTLMQVRYLGGIQQTALGNTFFEADRTLKILSTGFDNTTCAPWPQRPKDMVTELDLIGDEIGDGSRFIEGDGKWHRFWFEPSEEPLQTEGIYTLIPKNRLVVKDESIPPGQPSRKSAREFAANISANFLKMAESNRSFSDLQKAAALIFLAKWIRANQIPVDEDWVKGTPEQQATAATTPSITVMRAKLMDQTYLRYGIHGGVDFQKEPRYVAASPRLRRLSTTAEQSRLSGPTTRNSWQFNFEGQVYRAISLKISNPIQIRPRWVAWQRSVSRVLVQPKTFRAVIPHSDFIITNDTGSSIRIQLSGPLSKIEEVPTGSPTVLRVIPGSYKLKTTTRCGAKSDSVKVATGERHQLRYYCKPVPAPPPPPPPPPPSVGYFVVNNNTGAPLTVDVGGQSYTIAPGSSTIRLSTGAYTATVSASCGKKVVSLNVTNGSTYTGDYTCIQIR